MLAAATSVMLRVRHTTNCQNTQSTRSK